MDVVFMCPHCGCTIETDSELSGARAECPACSEIVLVPAPGVKKGVEIGGFRIEEKLGAGGMGEVFLATQLAMERSVALKILPPALTNDELTVKRFLHEVRMAAKLEHPNIVTAFDAGKADDFYYMAMAFVEGDDLKAILKEQGTIDEGDALTIIERVADALDYAWTTFKMLHRDLKPANIMITQDGEVKLMDMGIAKSVSEDSNLTMQGMVVGTPFYLSPEQAMSRSDIDCRADIYSLGATLFQMVTGRKPHQAPNAMAVVAKHISEDIEPPRVINPQISQGCNDLIMKMMARDREERFADWKELKDALTVLLSRPVREYDPADATETMVVDVMPPVSPSAPTVIEPAPQQGANPLVVAGVIAMILAIILIGGGAYVLTRDPDHSDEVAQTEAAALADPAPERHVGRPEIVVAPEKVDTPTVDAPIVPEDPPEDPNQVREDLIEMLRLAGTFAEDHPEDEKGVAAKYGLVRKHAQDLGQVRFVMQAEEELRRFKEDRARVKREEAERLLAKGPDILNEPEHVDNRHVPQFNEHPPAGEDHPNFEDDRRDMGRHEPGQYEMNADNGGRLRPPMPEEKKAVPPVYKANSKSELMKKLSVAVEKLVADHQYLPAAQLVDGYVGKYADSTRREREEIVEKLRKKYETFEPLRTKLRGCLRMIYEHRLEDAARFLDEVGDDREVRRTGTTGRNAIRLVGALIEARKRPGRKPRGLRGPSALVVGAFEMASRERMKDAAQMLVKAKDNYVAGIMLGELRMDLLHGTWRTVGMSAETANAEFHFDDCRVHARIGNMEIEGDAWIFGDWVYVRSHGKMRCWRVHDFGGMKLKIDTEGYASIPLQRDHDMHGPDSTDRPGGMDERFDRRRRVPMDPGFRRR